MTRAAGSTRRCTRGKMVSDRRFGINSTCAADDDREKNPRTHARTRGRCPVGGPLLSSQGVDQHLVDLDDVPWTEVWSPPVGSLLQEVAEALERGGDSAFGNAGDVRRESHGGALS